MAGELPLQSILAGIDSKHAERLTPLRQEVAAINGTLDEVRKLQNTTDASVSKLESKVQERQILICP